MKTRNILATGALLFALAGTAKAQELEVRVNNTPARMEVSQSYETPQGLASYNFNCETTPNGISGIVSVPEKDHVRVFDNLSKYVAATQAALGEKSTIHMGEDSQTSPIYFNMENAGISCNTIANIVMPQSTPITAALSTQQTLTAAEVSANAAQIKAFAARILPETPQSTRPTDVNLGFSGQCGGYNGLAVIGELTRNNDAQVYPETYLAFSTNVNEFTTLRDPARLQLGEISATRNDLNSDLTADGTASELGLRFHTSRDAAPAASTLLYINNITGTGASPTGNKPGRGLTDNNIPTSYHCKFSKEDLYVMQILEKITRVWSCDDLAQLGNTACYDKSTVFLRAEQPNTYHMDVTRYEGGYPVRKEMGSLGIDLNVTWTPSGELDTYTMQVNPSRTTNPKDTCVYLTHPQPKGKFWTFSDQGFTEPVCADNPAKVISGSFQTLLAGTSWKKPL